MTIENKCWIIAISVGIALSVVALTAKYYGLDEDFEYDPNWLGDLCGLKEETK